jgi:hypothetical protein
MQLEKDVPVHEVVLINKVHVFALCCAKSDRFSFCLSWKIHFQDQHEYSAKVVLIELTMNDKKDKKSGKIEPDQHEKISTRLSRN